MYIEIPVQWNENIITIITILTLITLLLHIYDSIALSRDIIDYAKGDGIPMSIINIYQEKAFDKVSL